MLSTQRKLWVLRLLFFLGLGLGFEFGDALKVPFRVKDVLPVLPRQISWPVLNNIHSAVDLLPQYIGSLAPNNGTIKWKGACFFDNEAKIEFTGAGDRESAIREKYSVFVVSYEMPMILDAAAFKTLYLLSFRLQLPTAGHVKQHGISVFLMPSGMLGTFLSLVDVLPLFSNTGWGQKDVHTGDFLAVSKIRGRWGGFETLEKWVTGAFAGHTAVCLKDESGNLWVGESGHENEKLDSGRIVDTRAVRGGAWARVRAREKKSGDGPRKSGRSEPGEGGGLARVAGKGSGGSEQCGTEVISVMSMWTRMQPAYAANMWNEALNMRLGTEDLDLHGILAETERRGITFDQLLTIPEQDEWVYSDGKSTTCVAFILSMYKEAGVFGPFSSSIQVTEFTIRDAYMLKIFENNMTRLPNWCNNGDDKLPFCQILGEYKMELPYYNTLEPYANMNENCPSLPPTYERPVRC
ncbi:hypothetical protein DH2020_003496 [Rehmannia glutinosa]|uniref:Uncharacterized protein n=1 Tax=Rehmannia glutinosa TaxID=99300 RepID=A0ABR0XLZ5_REHGL